MKDVIKLKQTESVFVEDENGVEYIRYSLVASMQKSVIDENKKLRARINKIKSKTADQHPKKGLWDAEKVCAWIGNHLLTSHQGYILEDLRKAMEE